MEAQPALADRARLRTRSRRPGSAEPRQHFRRRTGARSGPPAQQRRARERTGSAHRGRRRRTGDRQGRSSAPSPKSAQQQKAFSKQRPARRMRSTRRCRRASTKRAPRRKKYSTPSGSWKPSPSCDAPADAGRQCAQQHCAGGREPGGSGARSRAARTRR